MKVVAKDPWYCNTCISFVLSICPADGHTLNRYL